MLPVTPDKTDRLVVMDAPVPGIPPWDEIVRSPKLWHFSFGGPDAERLVAGRERIYLDRFWNEFAGDPSKIDEATRVHYTAFYAQPGAMHSAFAQFLSIPQDAEDNKVSMATRLNHAGARDWRRKIVRCQRSHCHAQCGR